MIRILLAPSRPASRKDLLRPCPNNCQTLIKSPIQGMGVPIYYCIDCHRMYVQCALEEWRNYIRRPESRLRDSRILPFRAPA